MNSASLTHVKDPSTLSDLKEKRGEGMKAAEEKAANVMATLLPTSNGASSVDTMDDSSQPDEAIMLSGPPPHRTSRGLTSSPPMKPSLTKTSASDGDGPSAKGRTAVGGGGAGSTSGSIRSVRPPSVLLNASADTVHSVIADGNASGSSGAAIVAAPIPSSSSSPEDEEGGKGSPVNVKEVLTVVQEKEDSAAWRSPPAHHIETPQLSSSMRQKKRHSAAFAGLVPSSQSSRQPMAAADAALLWSSAAKSAVSGATSPSNTTTSATGGTTRSAGPPVGALRPTPSFHFPQGPEELQSFDGDGSDEKPKSRKGRPTTAHGDKDGKSNLLVLAEGSQVLEPSDSSSAQRCSSRKSRSVATFEEEANSTGSVASCTLPNNTRVRTARPGSQYKPTRLARPGDRLYTESDSDDEPASKPITQTSSTAAAAVVSSSAANPTPWLSHTATVNSPSSRPLMMHAPNVSLPQTMTAAAAYGTAAMKAGMREAREGDDDDDGNIPTIWHSTPAQSPLLRRGSPRLSGGATVWAHTNLHNSLSLASLSGEPLWSAPRDGMPMAGKGMLMQRASGQGAAVALSGLPHTVSSAVSTAPAGLSAGEGRQEGRSSPQEQLPFQSLGVPLAPPSPTSLSLPSPSGLPLTTGERPPDRRSMSLLSGKDLVLTGGEQSKESGPAKTSSAKFRSSSVRPPPLALPGDNTTRAAHGSAEHENVAAGAIPSHDEDAKRVWPPFNDYTAAAAGTTPVAQGNAGGHAKPLWQLPPGQSPLLPLPSTAFPHAGPRVFRSLSNSVSVSGVHMTDKPPVWSKSRQSPTNASAAAAAAEAARAALPEPAQQPPLSQQLYENQTATGRSGHATPQRNRGTTRDVDYVDDYPMEGDMEGYYDEYLEEDEEWEYVDEDPSDRYDYDFRRHPGEKRSQRGRYSQPSATNRRTASEQPARRERRAKGAAPQSNRPPFRPAGKTKVPTSSTTRKGGRRAAPHGASPRPVSTEGDNEGRFVFTTPPDGAHSSAPSAVRHHLTPSPPPRTQLPSSHPARMYTSSAAPSGHLSSLLPPSPGSQGSRLTPRPPSHPLSPLRSHQSSRSNMGSAELRWAAPALVPDPSDRPGGGRGGYASSPAPPVQSTASREEQPSHQDSDDTRSPGRCEEEDKGNGLVAGRIDNPVEKTPVNGLDMKDASQDGKPVRRSLDDVLRQHGGPPSYHSLSYSSASSHAGPQRRKRTGAPIGSSGDILFTASTPCGALEEPFPQSEYQAQYRAFHATPHRKSGSVPTGGLSAGGSRQTNEPARSCGGSSNGSVVDTTTQPTPASFPTKERPANGEGDAVVAQSLPAVLPHPSPHPPPPLNGVSSVAVSRKIASKQSTPQQRAQRGGRGNGGGGHSTAVPSQSKGVAANQRSRSSPADPLTTKPKSKKTKTKQASRGQSTGKYDERSIRQEMEEDPLAHVLKRHGFWGEEVKRTSQSEK